MTTYSKAHKKYYERVKKKRTERYHKLSERDKAKGLQELAELILESIK